MISAVNLHGTGVLITRPRHQSENLRRRIEQDGGIAEVVPAIEIVKYGDLQRLQKLSTQLNNYDIAIFISANAVAMGLKWLKELDIPWPTNVLVGAIGQSTADALNNNGIGVKLIPKKYDSEGLLSLPEMEHITGKKVIIFRGRGGREHLANTLKERGALVEYAEVYERKKPALPLSRQLNIQQRKNIDVIVTTSNEGLENLVAIADTDLLEWLLSKALVVLSARGADKAKALGFRNTIAIAPQANDDAIIDTIKRIQIA